MRKGVRCLVLGGSGFIGTNLIRALLEAGCEVRSFDRSRPSVDWHSLHGDRFDFVQGGFADGADPARVIEGCETCFHLVSSTLPKSSNEDPATDVQDNLVATIRWLDAFVRAGGRRVVFASSGGTVYGRPPTVPIRETDPTEPLCSYGITKLAIEKFLRLYGELHGLCSVSLRLSNPYGEHQRIEAAQGAVAVFIGRILRGEPIDVWGDGGVVRDYVHISDVVRAMLAALAYEGPATVLNVGSGRGTSVNELIGLIGEVLGLTPDVRYLPGRQFDVPANVLDVGRAREVLGWQPEMALAAGLARTRDWILSSMPGASGLG